MAGGALLGAVVLGGLGYAWWRNKESEKSASPPPFIPGPDAPSPPGWDKMVGLYQTCVYGHCTPNDCTKLLAYIDSLVPDNDAEDEWLEDVRNNVVAACKASPSPSTPAPTPTWSWPELDRAINGCLQGFCSPVELASVLATLRQEDMISMSDADRVLTNDLIRRLSTGTSGTRVGGAIHVGHCGCEECEAKRAGHCCAECAAGAAVGALPGTGACSCEKEEEDSFVQTGRA